MNPKAKKQLGNIHIFDLPHSTGRMMFMSEKEFNLIKDKIRNEAVKEVVLDFESNLPVMGTANNKFIQGRKRKYKIK